MQMVYGLNGTALFSRLSLRVWGIIFIGLCVANCSAASSVAGVDPKYGVKPSPLVVAGGSVPKGGGRALVGKPYTIAGRTYVPRENPSYVNEGLASWYGPSFHGRKTANGEVFDKFSISAAHTTMPLPSYARVTNLANNRSIIVRVNDRGPYHGNRIIDVSQRVADVLAFRHLGTARMRVEYVGPASTNGSDDRLLIASLSTDGSPARLPGQSPAAPVLFAQAAATPPPSEPVQAQPIFTGAVRQDKAVTANMGESVASTVSLPATSASVMGQTSAVNPLLLAFAPLPPGRPAQEYPAAQEYPVVVEPAALNDGNETLSEEAEITPATQPLSRPAPIPPLRPFVYLSPKTLVAALPVR
jgi:rare lipoprotein A